VVLVVLMEKGQGDAMLMLFISILTQYIMFMTNLELSSNLVFTFPVQVAKCLVILLHVLTVIVIIVIAI